MKNQNNEQCSLTCPDTIEGMLEYLNLKAGSKNFRGLLDAAGNEDLSHEVFLTRLLSEECSAKFARQIQCRIAQARFPSVKTIDNFDFQHPASIPRQKILGALELSFVENAGGLVFIGPTGVGKTHLALAIGYKAATRGVRTLYTRAVDMINHMIASQADHSLHKAIKVYSSPALLVIDEVGYLPFDKQGSDHFFGSSPFQVGKFRAIA